MFFNGWNALLQTLVVGVIGYITIVVLLRVSGKRTLSKWNAFDFVVTIAYGSILASMLVSGSVSVLQGILAFALLTLFQFSITWLAVQSDQFTRWIKAEPTLLLYQGKFQYDALRRERVTEGEVLAALRANGSALIDDVEAVVLETDGGFSVIQQVPDGIATALSDVRGYPHRAAAQRQR
ncbi:DUF421 domain-containing protein [Romeria aff. gracilis LEGE 07310]|uniref:DUF421 domain-containing protein n=1 Tax=Vasconcelosia minhoensis LEGE 07310 TaxID=915328 RepID=A0A8J7AWL4_9CYAN|nr:YetF domain-containing protein [Romeria gracilis]MBE9078573.1 DUF421 domain-containing protein [Romeria aff. gracilis LEGE 07310]